MRQGVLKYKDRTGDLPDIGIIFCGNRAVVTFRNPKRAPVDHQNVYFGFFFWFRLLRACKKVYNKNI